MPGQSRHRRLCDPENHATWRRRANAATMVDDRGMTRWQMAANSQQARVPDIGGYDDVPVIEVLVAVGDTVRKDQGLVTLESDKATMEVPSPFAGIVRELKVKVGDALSEGAVVAMIETSESAAQATATAAAASAPAKPT